nr:hypothetical protein BHI3_19130 [Bacteriovorax sp. HI3]
MKKIFWPLVLLVFGCGVKVPDDNFFSCPTSEDFTGNGAIYNMNAGEKIANRFHLNGLNTATLNLSSVRLYMSTDNITSVTAKIYLGDDNDPDSGTLLGTGTGVVSTHTSNPNTPVDIYFSNPVKLAVTTPNSDSYYLVIESSSGAYDVTVSTISKISRSRMDQYTSGSWRIGAQGVENISMVFNYSGCSK